MTTNPTLFRTEAITKLGQSVEGIESDITELETSISNVRSIAEQALELAQNNGTSSSDEVYDAADEVQEADDEVVENLLNYDEYDFTSVLNNSDVFIVNSCKARQYKDGSYRFFITITTKTFPATKIQSLGGYDILVVPNYLSTDGASVMLKQMGGHEWVYVNSLGLVCSPDEQYTIACEVDGSWATQIHIRSTVPKETIEVSMPEGTKACDYTYDITTEVNKLQSMTQTNITFTSIKMTIRNYDRYYVHFVYSGTFNSSRNANTSAQALTSDYITATAELYPSVASISGYYSLMKMLFQKVKNF